jgi:hypothetical protein
MQLYQELPQHFGIRKGTIHAYSYNPCYALWMMLIDLSRQIDLEFLPMAKRAMG